jgi:hypothetical protein
MRIQIVASLAAGGVLLAACSSSSNGSAGGTSVRTTSGTSASTSVSQPTVASSDEPTLTVADVRNQLLSVSELPAGWSVDNSDDSGDDSPAPGCLDGVSKYLKAEHDVRAEADFTQGGEGFPALSEQIGVFTDASASFTAVTAKANSCTTFDFTSDGTKIHATMGQMSFPTLGDQSSAWSMTASAEGLTLDADIVIGTVGNEMFEFIYEDLGDTDTAFLERWAKTGVAKIRESS